MILATKPFLPPRDRYERFLEGIWSRQWVTNNGPLVKEYETRLKNFLQVNSLLYTSSGTTALKIAIKALDLKGDIITTPFSYVATTASIVWEGCNPIYVDIDPESLNINPSLIEEAITDNTSAILATHCFGNICDIDAIEVIANKYNLKVIYDAAHCFGTTYKGKSILEYGDISILSLHATKLIHSIEGGAVVTKSSSLLRKMALLRNFGHDGPEKFSGIGINGKNSEFHAAMGLAVLENAVQILKRRKEQTLYYDYLLKEFDVQKPEIHKSCGYNYAYYPIIFKSEEKMFKAKTAFEKNEIFVRRYFYPSLSHLDYVKDQDTPISDKIASSILCLPLYHDLKKEEQKLIAQVLLEAQKNG